MQNSTTPKPKGPPPKGEGQHVPDQTLFVPPGCMIFLAFFGILLGIGANVWQCYTTVSALLSQFEVKGGIYSKMSVNQQAAAQSILLIICWLIALSFQLAILFLVFRIERGWKENKQEGKGSGTTAKSTAIEVIQHGNLVLVWGIIALVVDAVGDMTFINLYTDSVFILFVYGAALYGSSTIMLAAAGEYLWAYIIAINHYKNWKAAGTGSAFGSTPPGKTVNGSVGSSPTAGGRNAS
jgi:hypothetical protein